MKLVSLPLCRCLIIAFVASATLTPRYALAACSNPSGIAGDVIYNGTYNVLQYCNSTNWINAGSVNSSGGGAMTAGDFCTTNGTIISCTTPFTGTGNVVLSASPTFTGSVTGASSVWSGTVSGVNSTWSGQVAIGTTTTSGALNVNGTVNISGALNVGGTATAALFSGSGASLTSIGTSNLTAVTGTPSSTTYLRGDGTWATVTSGTTTGSGVANYITMWTGTSSLGTSGIYQSGGNIAIGTTTTSGALNVNGTVTATTFSGSGALLTTIGTTNLTAVTGTASSTTFLAGNGVWTALTTGAMPSLASTDVWVGNGSNVATATATTGTGNVVMSTSPTLVTPVLGTPSSATLTNATGLPLTSGVAGVLPVANGGTNASTASITSFNNITGYTASGASGTTSTNLVFSASPTLTGTVAGANSTWTGQVAVGTTTTSGALNVSGTTTSTLFSGSGASLTSIGTANLTAITGSPSSTSFLAGNGVWTALTTGALPSLASTDVWVGNGSNVATATATTGTGSVVMSTSPTLVTPVLGTPTSATLTNATGLPLTTGVTGVLPVANGGTNASTASITSFNNITGYTASGATGTTSTNLVFSASPTLTGTVTAASSTWSGSVGIGTLTPNVNALLDVYSTTKGLLPPRMSSANEVSMGTSLPMGLVVYNITNNELESWSGTAWEAVGANAADAAGSTGQVQYNSGGDLGADAGMTYANGALTLGSTSPAHNGNLVLAGSSSGAVTIEPGATAAGTYNFNLPTGAGSAGQPLLSGGGGGTAMSFGTLGVAAGGTGAITAATGLSDLLGNPSTGAYMVNCTSGTSCTTIAATSAGVTSFSAGTTGLTPSSATTGAITLAGVLAVANGGTGASTASITSFNNITGYSASGATGTTSSNLVFSASPTLTGTVTGANSTWSGNVGVGTTVMSQSLTVNGNIDAMGSYNGYLTEIPNSSTATVVNKLARMYGANTVTVGTTGDSDGMIGVVVGNAGTAGAAQIAVAGQAGCIFDGAPSAVGDFVTISSTTAGDCHDTGSKTRSLVAGQVIGQVVNTTAISGSIYPVAIAPAGAGAGSTGTVSVGTQYYMAYYAANGTAVSGDSNITTDASNDLLVTSGKVGIGTTVPDDLLNVYSSANGESSISIETLGTQSAQHVLFNLTTKANGSELGTGTNKGWQVDARGDAFTGQADDFFINYYNGSTWVQPFTILPSGKVGIGTTIPSAMLDFGNNTAANEVVTFYDGGPTSRLGIGIQSSEIQSYIPSTNHFSWNSGGDLQTSGTNELMRLTGSGSLGIGSTSPRSLLDVAGTVYATTFNGSGASLTSIGTTNLTAITGTPSSSTYLRGDGTWASSGGSGTVNVGTQYYMAYYASNGTVLSGDANIVTDASNDLLVTSGKVGIGTLTPNASALLDVYSTTKGILPPRVTTALRNAISSPATGLVVYNTDNAELETYDGATLGWEAVGSSALDAAGSSGQVQYNSGGSLGADAGMTYANGALTLGSTSPAHNGNLVLDGSTSGAITVAPQAAAGTYNFNLPTSAGSGGQPLLSGGGGGTAMTFGTLGVAAGGTGAITAATGLSDLLGNPSSGAYMVNCTSGTSCTTIAATSAGVTSFSAGTTGLTPSSATTGAITLAGVLAVANGGTGASTSSITSFNNITGYSASGATGTTSSNLVFSASPTLTGTVTGASSTWSGNVGVGTTVMTQLLTVNGNIDAMGSYNGYLTEIPNSGTATVVNKLAKMYGANTVTVGTTGDSDGMIGIVVGQAGTTGAAQIAVAGQAGCTFDGTPSAVGDFVTISPTTAGDCHDTGTTTRSSVATQVIGQVINTTAISGSIYPVAVALSGAGAGSSGTVNVGTQYYMAYYAANGTAVSGDSAITTDASNDLLVTSGKVGIGTAAPTRALDVAATVTHSTTGTASQIALRSPTSPANKLNIGYDTTSDYGFIEAVDENTAWQNLVLQPTGGNVGIGTTGPVSPLTLNTATTTATTIGAKENRSQQQRRGRRRCLYRNQSERA